MSETKQIVLEFWKLRIDTTDKEKVKKFIKMYAGLHFVCFENEGEENPHMHAYFETVCTEKSIREWIRRHFGAGNRIYSMKEVEHNPVAYLAYLLKQSNFYHNLSEELMKEVHIHNEAVKTSMKEKKAAKRTQLQTIDDEYFKGSSTTVVQDRYQGQIEVIWSEAIIMRVVIAYFKERGSLIADFRIMSLVRTLSLKYVPSYDVSYANLLLDKMSK